MTLPKDLLGKTDQEIKDLLALHVFEMNLLIRFLVLTGYPVDVDVVDRTDPPYQDGRPEIIVNVGDR